MSVRGSKTGAKALRSASSWRVVAVCVSITYVTTIAAAQSAPAESAGAVVERPAAFSFAVLGDVVGGGGSDRGTRTALRAIDESPARFIVHFDLSPPSNASCGEVAVRGRRDILDAMSKPVVPVVAASEWAACVSRAIDPDERLARVGDTLFGSDESLGQSKLRLARQSSVPRFQRYRENFRWQVGNVLFVVLNLPDNDNNYRFGAGRNGEFEERLVANRAWLERSFRFAAERRLAGLVIFVDAAPRFGLPMRRPDLRSRVRDGYYEWKATLRDLASSFTGQVLLVQGHVAAHAPSSNQPDHPLRDAGGRMLTHFTRIAVPDVSGGAAWLRIEIEPGRPKLFRIVTERVFDDPSGELYGPARVR